MSFITCTLRRYYKDSKVKENEMGGTCSAHGRHESSYEVLVGKPEGKRPRHRWEDNIRMDLRVIGWKEGCGMGSSGSV
jgi:hypothetical protein